MLCWLWQEKFKVISSFDLLILIYHQVSFPRDDHGGCPGSVSHNSSPTKISILWLPPFFPLTNQASRVRIYTLNSEHHIKMMRLWSADPLRWACSMSGWTELQTLAFRSYCFLIKIPVKIIILAKTQHNIQYKIFVGKL